MNLLDFLLCFLGLHFGLLLGLLHVNLSLLHLLVGLSNLLVHLGVTLLSRNVNFLCKNLLLDRGLLLTDLGKLGDLRLGDLRLGPPGPHGPLGPLALRLLDRLLQLGNTLLFGGDGGFLCLVSDSLTLGLDLRNLRSSALVLAFTDRIALLVLGVLSLVL